MHSIVFNGYERSSDVMERRHEHRVQWIQEKKKILFIDTILDTSNEEIRDTSLFSEKNYHTSFMPSILSKKNINSILASRNLTCLLLTFENILDPNQAPEVIKLFSCSTQLSTYPAHKC